LISFPNLHSRFSLIIVQDRYCNNNVDTHVQMKEVLGKVIFYNHIPKQVKIGLRRIVSLRLRRLQRLTSRRHLASLVESDASVASS